MMLISYFLAYMFTANDGFLFAFSFLASLVITGDVSALMLRNVNFLNLQLKKLDFIAHLNA